VAELSQWLRLMLAELARRREDEQRALAEERAREAERTAAARAADAVPPENLNTP
jgi:hypothetical protein